MDPTQHICKLKDKWPGFLQIIIDDFTLRREKEGILLEVNISDHNLFLKDRDGKREFFNIVHELPYDRKNYDDQANKFYTDKRCIAYHIDCNNYPFRYISGGVLPIIRLEGEEYFCLFYRDNFPVGWNIANGASDNIDELLNPQLIIYREFGEELLILDKEKRFIYSLTPEYGDIPLGTRIKALQMWNIDSSEYKELPIPVKWVEGTDQILASVLDRQHTSGGYFLNVIPEDNGIEVDQIVYFNLQGNISLCDGEISIQSGALYNRIIGLFPIEGFEVDSQEFRPTIIYFDGKKQDSPNLEKLIRKYLEHIESSSIRQGAQQRYDDDKSPKYDLCPITRAVIKKYPTLKSSKLIFPKTEYKIFISYKSEDHAIAALLYEYLKKRGLAVFFSDKTLREIGVSDFATAIDQALVSATHLIIIGTKPEYFASGWVAYEWRSFHNAKLSNPQRQRDIFILTSLKIDELPWALRLYQVIGYDECNAYDSLKKLAEYCKIE